MNEQLSVVLEVIKSGGPTALMVIVILSGLKKEAAWVPGWMFREVRDQRNGQTALAAETLKQVATLTEANRHLANALQELKEEFERMTRGREDRGRTR